MSFVIRPAVPDDAPVLFAMNAAFNGDTQAAIDAVTGATLVDTLGYLEGLLAAAKAAQ